MNALKRSRITARDAAAGFPGPRTGNAKSSFAKRASTRFAGKKMALAVAGYLRFLATES